MSGNCEAFTFFENTALVVYNHDVLSAELLGAMMRVYGGTRMDSGGMTGTLSKDGRDIVEICITTLGFEYPEKPSVPDDFRMWSDEDYQASDEHSVKTWKIFQNLTKYHGWLW